jgi:hypothetical protein
MLQKATELVETGKTGKMYRIHGMHVGQDSSGGIATGYGLDGPGIESRWG